MGRRPAEAYYDRLRQEECDKNLLDILLERSDAHRATISDLLAQVCAFVACHEIAHVVWSKLQVHEWLASNAGRRTIAIFNELATLELPAANGEEIVQIDQHIQHARSHEEVARRATREANAAPGWHLRDSRIRSMQEA
ncbi:MAG: hypothetical protein KIT14_02215 [bacterium]|nr:hypothetical protein [bacterium]